MGYTVHEVFYTLQGEGAHAGRPAVFCRFAGCNLWTGREEDRDKAICRFCDTSFRGTGGEGGGRFDRADGLADHILDHWPAAGSQVTPFVVCTGGEPLLQLDVPLIEALHRRGCEIAVETNGTRPAPTGIDWLCVSPKAGAVLRQLSGDEFKLVYPQGGAPPERYERLAFSRFYLQPMDGPGQAENTARALDYCLANPRWRLSLQTHKLLGIP